MQKAAFLHMNVSLSTEGVEVEPCTAGRGGLGNCRAGPCMGGGGGGEMYRGGRGKVKPDLLVGFVLS